MKAMILAAGEGRRMLPLTRHTPKPLLKAGGKPLIVHQIEKLARAGVRECVINLAWLGARIEEALGDGAGLGVRIRYSHEHDRLETAGGIIAALPILGDEPFIVVNADIWTDYSYARLPALPSGGPLAHLVLVDNPAHNPRGDFRLGSDGLLALADAAAPALTFSGISVYHPRFFADHEPGFRPLLPLLQEAIRRGEVGGEHYTGRWMDIGTPKRLAALDAELRAQDAR